MEKEYYCSFCGKSNKEVFALITGEKDVNICSECVFLCVQRIGGYVLSKKQKTL